MERKYKILAVDDEKRIRELIRKYAEFEGHEVAEACDGMEAVNLVRNESFDLVIMDIMLPYLDGYSAVREIRKTSDVPVIMLSARGEEIDRIHGFEVGVDDYVTKPFSPKELMMRIDVILKRIRKDSGAQHETASFGGLFVDFTGRRVLADGKEIVMTPKEYELFFYLVRNKGIALSREKLICAVWGYDFYGDDRTLDTHIKLLRKDLGDYSSRIITLRGVGYRFDETAE